jgi:aminoglycoside phosphotransferase (APT) family kinase protein
MIDDSIRLKSVPIRSNTVSFYVKGALSSSAGFRAALMHTASANTVYQVSERDGGLECCSDPLRSSERAPCSHQPQRAAATNRSTKQYLFKQLSDITAITGSRLVSLYGYLEQHVDVPAPRIVHYDDSHAFFKHDIVLQDYHEGTTLLHCMTIHPQGLAPFHSDLYKTLHAIHRIPIKDVQKFWFPGDGKKDSYPDWETFMTEEIGKTRTMLKKYELHEQKKEIIAKTLDSLLRYVREKNYARVPIHGDVLPMNIIVSHTTKACRLARILDFERARIGDPLWDFVYYHGFVERMDTTVARQWKQTVQKHDKSFNEKALELYRVLFHAWSVRDMYEYPDSEERQTLGSQSLKILDTIEDRSGSSPRR